MAISIVNVTTAADYSSTPESPLSVPVPSGLADGDVLIFFNRGQASDTTEYNHPATWTMVSPYIPNSSGGRVFVMLLHVVTDAASEPPSYTFSATPNTHRTSALMVAFRGVDPTDPIMAPPNTYFGYPTGSIARTSSLDAWAPATQIYWTAVEATSGVPSIPTTLPDGFGSIGSSATSTDLGITRTALWAGWKDVPAGPTLEGLAATWGGGASPTGQSALLKPLGTGTPPANQIPSAAFTTSTTGLTASFNASSSVDPDGNIVSYTWNYGDGMTGTGVSVARTYAAAGTYTVTLTVADNNGATDTITKTVTVTQTSNTSPTASFVYSTTGLTASFNAAASSDANGTITAYNWSFGDGVSASGVSTSRTYAAAGTYSVGLTVTDNAGATGSITKSVTVGTVTEPPVTPPTSPGVISTGGEPRIRLLRSGFASVDQMLDTPGATWAHRGGSNNWPEMSEYAYDQSVLAGYGALEFSAQRTSDGWWVGSHDPDLNRVTGMTTLAPISAMTKAQVLALNNTLNAQGRPRPFYGLIDFLQKWTPTHVAIVDLKNAGAFQTEFLNLCDSNGGPTKIVMKSYGSSAGFADASAARGYERWGYFYQDNYTAGELVAWQSPWSILGMEIDATTAWTGSGNVLSYGKPVVGHIAASQAKYDLALTKGAAMVQCSNVAGIKPVSRW